MSTPTLATPPAALEVARQQLDELDALLERMLALPVYQSEEDPFLDLEPLAPVFSDDSPVAVDETLNTDQSGAESPTEPELTSLAPAWPMEVTAGEDSGIDAAVAHPSAVAPDPAIWPAPRTHEAPTEQDNENLRRYDRAPELLEPRGEELAPLPLSQWPFAFMNRVFDECVAPLGAVGRALLSERGKAALGGTGLLLLAGALAWAILDWLLWNW